MHVIDNMEHIKISKKISLIHTLLSNNNFLKELCNYSNNDLNIVIKNITKIINVILNIDNYKYTNLETILNVQIEEQKYNYIPSNTFFKPIRTRTEINKKVRTITPIDNLLKILNTQERELPYPSTDIEKQIIETLHYPKEFYDTVTCNSPYNILHDNEEDFFKDRIAQKLYENKIGSNYSIMLMLFISQRLAKSKPLLIINPINKPLNNLYFIEIPSIIDIIKICLINKKESLNYFIDYNTGNKYEIKRVEKQNDILFTYSRYEYITFDDTFKYSNDNLTGDIYEDFNKLYYFDDPHKSVENLNNHPKDNIEKIKEINDISLTYFDDTYKIMNGRHRILYLMKYYKEHKMLYTEERLPILKEEVTIKVSVISCIKDKEFNDLLNKLIKQYHIDIIKIDEKNDLPEILIRYNKKIYIIKNKNELKEFYNNLNNQELLNKYLIFTENKNNLDYANLFIELFPILNETIENINFLEFIEYLKNNKIITPEEIEIKKLYELYKKLIFISKKSQKKDNNTILSR